MSSKSLDEKIEVFDVEQHLKLKNLIIPFSKFSTSENYIYYGHERIPFNERNTTYQTILKCEFAEEMKEFMKLKKE